jgi:hypothetical protein
MSDKEQLLRIVSVTLSTGAGNSAAEIAAAIEAALERAGIKGRPLESWTEQRNDSSCTSGVAVRTCYRVNHGDGTYSETWCDPWHCF